MALELSGLTLHSFSQGQVGSQETTYSYVYIFSAAPHPHSLAGGLGKRTKKADRGGVGDASDNQSKADKSAGRSVVAEASFPAAMAERLPFSPPLGSGESPKAHRGIEW